MELLKDIGVEDIESVLKIIDKKDKLSDNDFENLLKAAYKMNDEMVFGIKDILNITSIADLEKLKLGFVLTQRVHNVENFEEGAGGIVHKVIPILCPHPPVEDVARGLGGDITVLQPGNVRIEP